MLKVWLFLSLVWAATLWSFKEDESSSLAFLEGPPYLTSLLVHETHPSMTKVFLSETLFGLEALVLFNVTLLAGHIQKPWILGH